MPEEVWGWQTSQYVDAGLQMIFSVTLLHMDH